MRYKKNSMIDDIFAKFDGAFAKNTIRAYRSDFNQYQNWCLQNNLDPIPDTAEIMAKYIDYLSETSELQMAKAFWPNGKQLFTQPAKISINKASMASIACC